MANELTAARVWARGRLAGDATLVGIVGARIYADHAPDKDPATGEAVACPLLIVSVQLARDSVALGGTRVETVVQLNVRVVGDDDTTVETLESAIDRVEAALEAEGPFNQLINGTIYTVHGAQRTLPLDYSERSGGRDYAHRGGIWRMDISIY